MEIAKYRIADQKGAYMPRTPALQLLALGSDHASAAVYNIRAPLFEHLHEGEIVEFEGVPGPHLEPLNDEAKAASFAYWKANPHATLDPTRKMPLGQDPMGGRSVEQLVVGLLEKMDQGPAAAQPVADMTALLAGQKVMQDAMASLAQSMAVLAANLAHPPVTTGTGVPLAPAKHTEREGRAR